MSTDSVTQAARSRWRRALFWLAGGAAVHLFVVVALILAIVCAGSAPLSAWAAAFVVVPGIGLAAWEHRRPSRRRPTEWPIRVAMITLPHAIGAALAVVAIGATPWTAVIGGVTAFACPLIPVGLASRAVRSPLGAELGLLDIDVDVKLRVPGPGYNRWSTPDYATLAINDLQVTVGARLTTALRVSIPLGDLTDVTTRPAAPFDNPWIRLGGRCYTVEPGTPVLAITHREGGGVLPVYDPEGFAAVLKARLAVRARR
jgi:hypothetical protein